jgi:hypothetical protein
MRNTRRAAEDRLARRQLSQAIIAEQLRQPMIDKATSLIRQLPAPAEIIAVETNADDLAAALIDLDLYVPGLSYQETAAAIIAHTTGARA